MKKTAVSIFLYLILSASAVFATGIAIDTSSAGSGTSRSITLAAGNNRILIGIFGSEGASNVDDMTYEGVSMQKVDEVDPEGSGTLAMFYMLEEDLPAPGAHTLAVSLTGAPANNLIGAIILQNVAQQAPEANASVVVGSGKTIDTDITTVTAGAWLIDGVFSGDTGTYDADSGQLEQFDVNTGATCKMALGVHTIRVPATVNHQWTDSDSNPFRQGLIVISVAQFVSGTAFDGITLNGVQIN